MKTKHLCFGILLIIMIVTSCGSSKKKSLTQQHIPVSKNIVGIWNQFIVTPNNKVITTGNYKVINPDGTFYTFIVWGTNPINRNKPTSIGLYGNYKLNSDSTYTEHIIEHFENPKLADTESELKYKLLEENVLLIKYRNDLSGVWIPELWRRVETTKKQSTFM